MQNRTVKRIENRRDFTYYYVDYSYNFILLYSDNDLNFCVIKYSDIGSAVMKEKVI